MHRRSAEHRLAMMVVIAMTYLLYLAHGAKVTWFCDEMIVEMPTEDK